jgi:hypothetical protein
VASSINDVIKEAFADARAAGLPERELMSLRYFTALKGDTDVRGAFRYYLNDHLNEYVDIAREDVIAEKDLAGAASPFVLVLVRCDARIEHHLEVSGWTSAGFLSGDIAARHLMQSRMGDPSFFGAGPSGPAGAFRTTMECASFAGACQGKSPGC